MPAASLTQPTCPSQPPLFPVPLSPFHTMVASALSLSVAARPALATRPAAPK